MPAWNFHWMEDAPCLLASGLLFGRRRHSLLQCNATLHCFRFPRLASFPPSLTGRGRGAPNWPTPSSNRTATPPPPPPSSKFRCRLPQRPAPSNPLLSLSLRMNSTTAPPSLLPSFLLRPLVLWQREREEGRKEKRPHVRRISLVPSPARPPTDRESASVFAIPAPPPPVSQALLD